MTATKPTKTRIYAVTRKASIEGTTRLIRATSPASALAFVAHNELSSELAGQDEIIAAIKAGIDVEESVDPASRQMDIEDAPPIASAQPTNQPEPTETASAEAL